MQQLRFFNRSVVGGRLPRLPDDHPFAAGLRRAAAGRAELAFFAYIIREPGPAIRRIPRLKVLQDEFGLYPEFTEGEAVRFVFGSRRTFRFLQNERGRIHVRERGPQLVYSVGPDGTIAIMLFPPHSELVSTVEEVIFLGIGRYGGGALAARLTKDLKSLAAYTHVTSVDGSPTLSETLRVWWLRSFHPHTIKGEFKKGVVGLHAGSVGLFTLKTVFTAAFTAFFRPIGVIVVLWWVVTQLPSLVDLLPRSLFTLK